MGAEHEKYPTNEREGMLDVWAKGGVEEFASVTMTLFVEACFSGDST